MTSLTEQLAGTWWQMQLRRAVRTMPALVVALAVGTLAWVLWLAVKWTTIIAWRGVRVAWWMACTRPRLVAGIVLAPALAASAGRVWWPLAAIPAGLIVLALWWRQARRDSWHQTVALPAQVNTVRRRWRRVATASLHGKAGRLPGTTSASLTRTRKNLPIPRILAAKHTNEGRRLNLTLGLPLGMIARDLDAADMGKRLAAGLGAKTASVSEPRPGIAILSLTMAGHPADTTTPHTPTVPDALDIGRTEHGDPWLLPTGMHAITAGVTGAGKGSVMWSAIEQLGPHIEAGTVRLAGIDLKGGMELAHGRNLFTEFATTPEAAGELLGRLARDMTARASRMAGRARKHTPTTNEPAWVIVIDELAMITAYINDARLKKQIGSDLAILLSQGRAPGFTIWAFLQDPAKDVLELRQHFPVRVALRLMEPTQTAMMLGQQSGAECHLIDPSLPGTGYVRTEDGHVVRVRARYLDDEAIHDMAEKYAPVPAPVEGEREQFVYFIAEDEPGGRIKIGVAGDVRGRLKQLQTAASGPLRLLGTMPGGQKQEKRLHRRFSHLQTHGEWFEAAADLTSYINENTDQETQDER